MNIPADLKYSKSHEWVRVLGDGRAQLGLTDFAQSELGDLVFVTLPEIGEKLAAGEPCGDVESVKAVSDIFSPVDGTVAAVNEVLLDEPGNINEDCYGTWMIELEDVGGLDALMDAAAYEKLLAEAQ